MRYAIHIALLYHYRPLVFCGVIELLGAYHLILVFSTLYLNPIIHLVNTSLVCADRFGSLCCSRSGNVLQSWLNRCCSAPVIGTARSVMVAFAKCSSISTLRPTRYRRASAWMDLIVHLQLPFSLVHRTMANQQSASEDASTMMMRCETKWYVYYRQYPAFFTF
jgi:hypothetical protein